jgi:hypothetical protein
MVISINSRMSGFRKWGEAQELKRVGKADGAAGWDGVIAAPDLDDEFTTRDQTVHLPWLVPGAGKL